MIVLLELLTVLLEYIDLFVIAILITKNSYYYTNILPIMLALCSMLLLLLLLLLLLMLYNATYNYNYTCVGGYR